MAQFGLIGPPEPEPDPLDALEVVQAAQHILEAVRTQKQPRVDLAVVACQDNIRANVLRRVLNELAGDISSVESMAPGFWTYSWMLDGYWRSHRIAYPGMENPPPQDGMSEHFMLPDTIKNDPNFVLAGPERPLELARNEKYAEYRDQHGQVAFAIFKNYGNSFGIRAYVNPYRSLALADRFKHHAFTDLIEIVRRMAEIVQRASFKFDGAAARSSFLNVVYAEALDPTSMQPGDDFASYDDRIGDGIESLFAIEIAEDEAGARGFKLVSMDGRCDGSELDGKFFDDLSELTEACHEFATRNDLFHKRPANPGIGFGHRIM